MVSPSYRTYRPDIDGLRAVAIVLVLLFHVTNQCPGGFVGVDVFFVISGFLITGLLLDAQQRGSFNLDDFWIGRIRRLLPAATLILLATLVAGFVVMFPDSYDVLAKSVVAQQILASNIYFWRKSGYFESSAELKPLLHTWSLAVEEQFYVWYPIALLFLGRLPHRVMVAALLMAAEVSFGLSDWGVRTYPLTAFYLLPSRAWEILLSAWAFNKETPFPGRAALLPCMATALLIYANSLAKTWVGRILETPPVVFVGLISYSLYLWHWPLLSFAADLGPLDRTSKGVALAASFVLAVVSWRYVELPFRRKDVLPETKSLIMAAVGAVSLLLTASSAIIVWQGLPGRIYPQALSYAETRKRDWQALPFRNVTLEEVEKGRLVQFGATHGDITCLLWGDSKAEQLVSGIDAACKTRGVRGFRATYAEPPPLLDFVSISRWGLCEKGPLFNRAVLDFAIAEHVNNVFIAGL